MEKFGKLLIWNEYIHLNLWILVGASTLLDLRHYCIPLPMGNLWCHHTQDSMKHKKMSPAYNQIEQSNISIGWKRLLFNLIQFVKHNAQTHSHNTHANKQTNKLTNRWINVEKKTEYKPIFQARMFSLIALISLAKCCDD